MSANADSVASQGEFTSKIPPSEPLTTTGHSVGTKIGNDAAPEFHAQVLPAGTAPAERTFQPNPINETPGQANNDDTLRSHGKESTYTSAESTLGGATSGDVHTGIGKPIQGQTRNDPTGTEGGSLAGRGASGVASTSGVADGRDDARQRGLDREGGALAGKKDTLDGVEAENREPVGATELAAERD